MIKMRDTVLKPGNLIIAQRKQRLEVTDSGGDLLLDLISMFPNSEELLLSLNINMGK